MRRGATLSLLLLGASGLLARGLASNLSVSVASLTPVPERRPPAAQVAVQHEALSRPQRAAGANSPPTLWPSPYELAPDEERSLGLAPNPYGELAALAPDPYLDQHTEDHAGPWTSSHHESPAGRRMVDTRPRLALAPSPYRAMELVPNPY